MNICLTPMTKALARRYYEGYIQDPALLTEGQQYQLYHYSADHADATVEKHRKLGRVYLAVMLDNEPIGEIILKNIDQEHKHCTLSISLQCDTVKNKGYGTAAEILALHYAFHDLNMDTVFADTVLKNTRSQHVLKKVGFVETNRDDTFIFYRCDKSDWDGA